MTDVRAVCLDCLLKIEKGEFCHLVLRNALEVHGDWDRRDRAFLTRLTEGCVEHRYELDAILDSYSRVKTKKMKPVIRNVLRMAVYQMKYMDSVPDRAAVNEAVRLAKRRGFSSLQGFVNGVLRTVSRELPDWRAPEESENFTEWARVVCSMPVWITEAMRGEYGEARTAAMLRESMSGRPLTVRFNLSRASEEAILTSLRSQKIHAEAVEGLTGVYRLSGYDSLSDIRAFSEGLFQVQDVSSVLAGLAASPKAGDHVLDVCAAPGGKSLHAADLLKGTGLVEARDLSDEKTDLIRDNIRRSRFENITAKTQDALIFDPEKESWADILIADLPCSGLGIIGRKSDIKYHITPEGQTELAALQRRILDTIWRYVKPGGRLVYSTCTLFPSENRENAEWFAKNYPFEPESLAGRIPERFLKAEAVNRNGFVMEPESGNAPSDQDGNSVGNQLQLLPGEHGTDGFFISSFIRKREGDDQV